MTIRKNIGRNNFRDKGNGMIMGATRRRKSIRIVKNRLVFVKERIDVQMNCR